MQSAQQKQIVGFFIEETKEHLDTLEQGLVDLQATMTDSERVNELFRAAHSVKGGAAMLGFSSIQKTAHRLEDCFKVLKENPIQVDQHIESLFLKGLDTLRELAEQLQSPFGLREDEAEQIVQAAEPMFEQLQTHLNNLVSGGTAPAPVPAPAAPAAPPPQFVEKVTGVLRQMLVLFKQAETPSSRQQLVGLCDQLSQLGSGLDTWQTVVQAARQAIANSQNTYAALPPIVVKELKQAADLIQARQAKAVAPSAALQKLAGPVPTPVPTAAPTPEPAPVAASPESPKQITIPLEPRQAAEALIKAFDRPQLTELAKLLVKVLR